LSANLLSVFVCLFVSSLRHQATAAFAPRVAHVQRTAPLAAEGTNIPGPPYSGPAVKPILDSVQSPADMKRLDMRQLKQVTTLMIKHDMRTLFNNSVLITLSHNSLLTNCVGKRWNQSRKREDT
jgi:hypothetical protein